MQCQITDSNAFKWIKRTKPFSMGNKAFPLNGRVDTMQIYATLLTELSFIHTDVVIRLAPMVGNFLLCVRANPNKHV